MLNFKGFRIKWPGLQYSNPLKLCYMDNPKFALRHPYNPLYVICIDNYLLQCHHSAAMPTHTHVSQCL